jgi:hypothetical protein
MRWRTHLGKCGNLYNGCSDRSSQVFWPTVVADEQATAREHGSSLSQCRCASQIDDLILKASPNLVGHWNLVMSAEKKHPGSRPPQEPCGQVTKPVRWPDLMRGACAGRNGE